MAYQFLDQPISKIPGVGAHHADLLHKLDVFTAKDLIHHYPFRYEDRDATQNLSLLNDGDIATVSGSIENISNIRTRTGKTMQKGIFLTSDDELLEVVWFNQPYLVTTLKKFKALTLSGKIKRFRDTLTLQSPIWEAQQRIDQESLHTNRLVPIYHTTQGITNKWLRGKIAWLLKQSLPQDFLDEDIITNNQLEYWSSAIHAIHFPPTSDALVAAKKRLSFDELLLWQLRARINKRVWLDTQVSPDLSITNAQLQLFLDSLPFTLTSAQMKVLSEIRLDLTKIQSMNRLIQGDVGSGKTVLAAFACYIAACNSLPSVVMAPTESLALQHAKTLADLLNPLGISINTQTRSQKKIEHSAQLFVGTHALLHRPLPDKIGVVVIDEQHRFGVKQRAQLLDRHPAPHVLSMTATPIPRTIALTLYADLDISILDELPPGRITIKTWVVPPSKRKGAYEWITKQLNDHGSQAFIVCPLIEDSENSQLAEVKAVETEYAILKNEVFTQHKLGLVHGRMSSKQKNAALEAFKNHETDILVATPVIEVGIDIPNATIMVIEGAQRFGLAQLHQLRGRVGRGSKESYCLLFASDGKTSKRLKYLETINSGFELAELDMKLRGMGDLYGVKQSGAIDLKIASLQDTQLISATYEAAGDILAKDPDLSDHSELKLKINSLLEKGVGAN